MKVTINIQKEKVFQDVYSITGHEAKTQGEMDKVSATEDEGSVLEPFLSEATAALGDVVSPYGTISTTETTCDIAFEFPANWKQTAQPALESALANYLVNSICAKWFAITSKEDSAYYQNKLNINSANIRKLLCERTRPTR